MTAKTFPLNDPGLVEKAPATEAHNDSLIALAFVVFAAAIMSLAMLPSYPAGDRSEISALETVAGP